MSQSAHPESIPDPGRLSSATPAAPPVKAVDALPVGTRLGEFEIRQVLGAGGFGIVYLAFDHALEREVALKEYMPAALAARSGDTQVSLRSTSHADTFATGLRSFVNEARLLAQFDHPSLVKVYRFWEANNTAYMAMPYYRGITLHAARRAMVRPPDEAWLRQLVEPLLGALEVLHDQAVYHRDIAPDNILILEGGPHAGRPVLLDFGAARRVIGDRTQNLTAILKPAFAPVEQYADVVHLKQGPWTDLYALGAVLYFVLGGQPPVPAATRAVHDELPSARKVASVLAQVHPGLSYSDTLLDAIDWALAVRPDDRPQSVQAFRDALAGLREPPASRAAAVGGPPAAPPAVPLAVPPAAPVSTVAMPSPPAAGVPPGLRSSPSPSWVAWAVAGAAIVAATAGLGWWATGRLAGTLGRPDVPAAEAAPAAASAAEMVPAVAPPPVSAAEEADEEEILSVAVPAPAADAASGPVHAPAPQAAPAESVARPAPVAPPAAATPLPAPSPAPAPAPVPAPGERGPADSRPSTPTAASERPAGSIEQPPAAERAAATPAVVPPAPEARQPVQRPPAPTAPPPAAGPEPATPREACGRRVLLALWRCMQEQCASGRFAQHPQCVEWRALEERNRAPDDY